MAGRYTEALGDKQDCDMRARFFRDGTHQPPSRVLEGYPLLPVRNIVKGQLIRLPDDSMISKDDFRALNKSFSVRENDVLLAIVRCHPGLSVAVVGPIEPFVIQRSLAIHDRGRSSHILLFGILSSEPTFSEFALGEHRLFCPTWNLSKFSGGIPLRCLQYKNR